MMIIEHGRRLWHNTPLQVKQVRNYYDWNMPAAGVTAGAGLGSMIAGPMGAVAGGATGGIFGGIAGLFGKKPKRDVPDPLVGLWAQLQALAGQVPAQVGKMKEINTANVAQAKLEGGQAINENIRAERGMGNTSLQDRLNTELANKLFQSQSAADLAAENWGIGQQANILNGTAGMYPSQTQLPQEPSWGANLLGAGAQMALQNYQEDQQWKRILDMLNSKSGGVYQPSAFTPAWKDAFSGSGSQFTKF